MNPDDSLSQLGQEQEPDADDSKGKEGVDSTTLSIKDHPELKGLKKGADVKGSWEGQIQSIDGDMVTIGYNDGLKLETENAADREYSKLTGKSGRKSKGSSSSEEPEY